MKILLAALILAAPAVRAADAPAPAGDFLIVYGAKAVRRAGPIGPQTTYADLVKIFGAKKLKNATIVLGEDGNEQPSTEILDKDAAATLVWESDARKDLASVIFSERTSRWHTKEGLKPGLSLRGLQKLNGKPFQFSGLGWDYGGLIQDADGRLAAMSGLSLVLDGNGPPDDLTPFLGDSVKPMSNAPGADKAGIFAGSLTLNF